jgi:hypothetical protein
MALNPCGEEEEDAVRAVLVSDGLSRIMSSSSSSLGMVAAENMRPNLSEDIHKDG